MVYDSLITEDGRNFGRNMEWERLTKIEVVGHVGVVDVVGNRSIMLDVG